MLSDSPAKQTFKLMPVENCYSTKLTFTKHINFLIKENMVHGSLFGIRKLSCREFWARVTTFYGLFAHKHGKSLT